MLFKVYLPQFSLHKKKTFFYHTIYVENVTLHVFLIFLMHPIRRPLVHV